MSMSKSRITLFLTENNSLKDWERSGLLQREMAVYRELMSDYSIQVYSYGNVADLEFEQYFPDLTVLLIPYYQKNKTLKNRIHLFNALSKLKKSVLFKTNQIKGATLAIELGKRFQIPVIVRCGYLLSKFTEGITTDKLEHEKVYALEKQLFENAHIGVTTTERERQFALDKYDLEPTRITVIPNYVDQTLFAPHFGNREEGHVLYIGRLSEEKNLFNLIDAFNQSTFAKKLTLIGSGRLENELKEKASEGAKPVEFLGAVPNEKLPEYLQKKSVYVLCSLFEGLPKSLLEAMSCATPCLGTDVIGINSVIHHGIDGHLTATDAESMANGLDLILSNKNYADAIGKRAFETIHSSYSLEKVVQIEKNWYEQIRKK